MAHRAADPLREQRQGLPQEAIDKVAASIAEFGFRQPIVVDSEGVILAGHTRLLAAQKLGLAEVPVHVAAGLSPAQAKAYRLMDNRSNQETTWDLDLLLAELLGCEIDISLTGFGSEEIAALLATPTEGLCDPDEAPELPEEPVSQPGDLYLLGAHRLLCGDSTDPERVRRLMAGKRAVLMHGHGPALPGRLRRWQPPPDLGSSDGKAISV